METFELLFGFAEEAWVRYGVPMTVDVEVLDPYVNSHLCACADMLHFAFSFESELTIIAISPA